VKKSYFWKQQHMVVICIVLTQVMNGRRGTRIPLGVFGVALGEQCLWLFIFLLRSLAAGNKRRNSERLKLTTSHAEYLQYKVHVKKRAITPMVGTAHLSDGFVITIRIQGS
jgi:hypothetical protein